MPDPDTEKPPRLRELRHAIRNKLAIIGGSLDLLAANTPNRERAITRAWAALTQAVEALDEMKRLSAEAESAQTPEEASRGTTSSRPPQDAALTQRSVARK
jgi:two-component sensor histidine kinase